MKNLTLEKVAAANFTVSNRIYNYIEISNLLSDISEEIDTIKWNLAICLKEEKEESDSILVTHHNESGKYLVSFFESRHTVQGRPVTTRDNIQIGVKVIQK